ncbi:hypothetical protein ABZ829_35410 [Streptomyces xanthochromogenes]|uniref:hypothetical protein n=1 Tax=Streptomyces xanthochromogenes TaxID=67384 RepID=UPI00342DB24F
MKKLPKHLLPACFTQVKGGRRSLQPFAVPVGFPQAFTPEFEAEIVELCRRGDRSIGQASKVSNYPRLRAVAG